MGNGMGDFDEPCPRCGRKSCGDPGDYCPSISEAHDKVLGILQGAIALTRAMGKRDRVWEREVDLAWRVLHRNLRYESYR